jgi:hypothetical protein
MIGPHSGPYGKTLIGQFRLRANGRSDGKAAGFMNKARDRRE